MDLINSGIEWKQPLNICRCCLTTNCYKEISSEYYCSGQREVYEDMLKEALNIQISREARGTGNGNRLICEECITRLRDAYMFKRMVVRSVETFTEYLERLQSEYKDENTTVDEIKVHPIKIEPLQLDDVKCDGRPDDDSNFDDDEILANIKFELSKVDESIGSDAGIDDDERSSQDKSGTRKAKVNGDVNDIGNCKRPKTEKDWLKIAERRGNGPILRENSLKLLANSTMCVFQWNKSRYRCFCCKEPFSDMNTLREHTNNKHTLKNIEKKIILQQNRLVKVEVSTLYCKLCQKQLINLSELREHLSDSHNISFELKEDLLVPFKIDGNLQCQICNEYFTVFRLLNIHMNKHFQKQVCHICGAGFSNLVFLNLHKTRTHRPFTCKECNIIFNNKIDKKNHDINIHDAKFERKLRFPCPYCQERFFQENFRVQHLVEKHGMMRPEHKCNMCSKVFITRSLCNNHVKNVHMKEKNHECDICHNLFYTKSDVARHRVTHTGEKKFSCSLCNNLFATKDSLRRHMKRTHVGVN